MSNKAKQRSNEPVALFAGVGQVVVMVAGARKHGQGAGVWRARRGQWAGSSPSPEAEHVQAEARRGKPLQQSACICDSGRKGKTRKRGSPSADFGMSTRFFVT